jgi:hypothetical protein
MCIIHVFILNFLTQNLNTLHMFGLGHAHPIGASHGICKIDSYPSKGICLYMGEGLNMAWI